MGLNRDLQTINRSLRGRWPISEERRSLLMEEMQLIFLTSTNDKVRLRAMEIIHKLDELNLRDETFQAQQKLADMQTIELQPEQVEEIGYQVESLMLPLVSEEPGEHADLGTAADE